MPRFAQVVGFLAAALCVGLSASQTAFVPSTGLMGTVKASDGKPMEGVVISARAQDQTFTTSVYTNRDGEYVFPSLDGGEYRISAQAVGFEMARSEKAISSRKKIQQHFTLKPFQNFHKQLSPSEWMDSLPDDTPEDRRMKRVFFNSCTSCHDSGFALAKRFDAAGWALIIDYMTKGTNRLPAIRSFEAYKEELVAYLTRVRGPQSLPLKLKPHPRPTGEATAIVVTEYDIPAGDQPEEGQYAMSHDGSNWSEGIPNKDRTGVLHDAVVNIDGSVYFTDGETPERTTGKLDPKTGRVTGYKLAGKDGIAVSTHGAAVDQKGNVWFTSHSEHEVLKFDPKAEKFQRFPKPSSMTHGIKTGVAVDSKGIVWAAQPGGAFRLDPETGAYTEFKSVTKGGEPYGITVDAEDNAWYPEIALDRVGVVDGRTGKVSAVVLPPFDEEASAKDREIGQRIGADSSAAPLYQKGPRRLGADRNGDAVWVAEYWVGRLAKIDIHTRKVTEYKVPHRFSHPYSVVVDKNHMVWFCGPNSSRIGKFNPSTEQFTDYALPTLGINCRKIDVDNSTDPPTVWVGYTGSNKIARVQFRTDSARPADARKEANSRGY